MVAGHGQDIAQTKGAQLGPEPAVAAVHLVGGHPGGGQPGGDGATDHRQRELGLGGKADLLRHVGLGPPVGVLGPRLG